MLPIAIGDGVRGCQGIGLELDPVHKPLLVRAVLLVLRCYALDHLVESDLNDALVPPAILAEVDVLPWVEHTPVHIVVRIEEVFLDLLLGMLRLLTGAGGSGTSLPRGGRLR